MNQKNPSQKFKKEAGKRTEKFDEKVDGLQDTNKAILNLLEDLEIEKKKLAEAKVKNEAILASIGDGIIATDSNRRIIIMNKMAEKLLGWKIDEAIGKLYDDIVLLEDEKGTFVPPDERPMAKAFSSATTTTTTTTMSLYLLSKNKIKFPVAITVSPIILGNKIIGAVEVFRNITEEKEIQQAKDDFLSITAHDLRTPITGIRANIEMLLAGDYGEIPPKFKVPLQDIDKANLGLVKMVDDFLTIGRMEKGKITIKPYPIDLLPILDFHVDYIKPLAEKRNLKFDCEIPTKLPQVMADADKIPEVITNLLDNAIKYTNKGSISLRVVVEKDSVVVRVADTGIGITEEQQKNIFQKYAQIDGGKKIALGKGTGLGLGLYISRLIIEGCKGKIWVESELGKGSTFYFSLPLAKKHG